MSQKPILISIIVAVFNGDRTLQQCIDSVANQTYEHKQLIVIDGGSTDGTVSILRQNKDIIDFSISEKDHGIYDAWNKGVSQSNGDWVCFLGADDYFYDPRVLEKMVEHLNSVPLEIDIAYGRLMLVDDSCKPIRPLGESWSEIKTKFSQMMCIPHPAVFHRRALFEKHGKFNDKFKIAGDYEMLLRALKDGDACSFMDVMIVGMRTGGMSSRRENVLPILKEVRAAQKMHGQRFINLHLLSIMVKEYLGNVKGSLLGEKAGAWRRRFKRAA